jgi:hypothetical protein
VETGKTYAVGVLSSGKQPYEPPEAVSVPLKLEERLLSCGKFEFGPGCYQDRFIS